MDTRFLTCLTVVLPLWLVAHVVTASSASVAYDRKSCAANSSVIVTDRNRRSIIRIPYITRRSSAGYFVEIDNGDEDDCCYCSVERPPTLPPPTAKRSTTVPGLLAAIENQQNNEELRKIDDEDEWIQIQCDISK